MASSIITPPIVTNGLICYLDSGNLISYPQSGTVWTDLSGNGNNATFSGYSFTTSNIGVLTTSTLGQIVTTYSTASGANNTTMIMWYKWDGINQASPGMLIGDIGTKGYGFLINSGGNNGTAGNKVSVFYPGSAYNVLSSYGTLVTNKWTQLSITRNTTTTTLYQDGVFIGSTNSTPGNNTLPLLLYINYDLNGSFGVSKFYNRALSQQEILQNYNAIKGRFGLQ